MKAKTSDQTIPQNLRLDDHRRNLVGSPHGGKELSQGLFREPEVVDESGDLNLSRPQMERPKILFSRRKRYALREFLLVHLLPIALTFSVFGLYLGGVSWRPPWPGTTILNLLQVAAKVHETMIIASLAAISFHHIGYRLLSRSQHQGLRLGLLTSPFQMNSPLYLFSQEFASTCARVNLSTRMDLVTISLHVFLVVLAAVTGPSTAIAILPKLGWWPGPANVHDSGMSDMASLLILGPAELYLGSPFKELYPSAIDQPFLHDTCSKLELRVPLGDKCPFSVFTKFADNWYETMQTVYQARDDTFNITIQAPKDDVNETIQPRKIHAKLPGPVDIPTPAEFGNDAQG